MYSRKSLRSEDERLQYLSSIKQASAIFYWQRGMWRKNNYVKLLGTTGVNEGWKITWKRCSDKKVLSLFLWWGSSPLDTISKLFFHCRGVVNITETDCYHINSEKGWLMNVDTKISSKVIALGMKKVLPNIINYDQTAYVKNRYIGESIRVINDILYHAEQENLDGVLFAADMEKSIWFTLSSQPLLDLDLSRNLFSRSGPFCGMAVLCYEQWSLNRIFKSRMRCQTGWSSVTLPLFYAWKPFSFK